MNNTIDDIRENFDKLMLDNKENIHQLILSYLKEKKAINDASAISPATIAKHIFGEKATKKTVNSYLYSMIADGKVRKVTDENMKRPRWYLSG